MANVGQIVHYVSYGTPKGEYTSQCRAAIVTAVVDSAFCALAVLNPTGMFFNECMHDELSKAGGTWHWPEEV